jgi:hypothetical protein
MVKAPSWEGVEWINLPPEVDSLNINDFKGKVIYLSFFQKWWPGCHKYGFPALQEIASYYSNDPQVAVVTIQTTFEGFGTNTFSALSQIAEKYNLTIPIGHSGSSGNPSPLLYKYSARGTPWIVIIDKSGRIRFSNFHLNPSRSKELIEELKKENYIPLNRP